MKIDSIQRVLSSNIASSLEGSGLEASAFSVLMRSIKNALGETIISISSDQDMTHEDRGRAIESMGIIHGAIEDSFSIANASRDILPVFEPLESGR